MSTTVSDGRQSRGGEIPGDWERWLAAQGGDNEERLQRLRRGLRQARREELTERQRQVLALCYDQGLSVTEAASRLGVAPSTLSPTHAAAGPAPALPLSPLRALTGPQRERRFLLYFFPAQFIMVAPNRAGEASPEHEGG